MKTHRLVLFSLIGALVVWSGMGWAQQPRSGGTLRIALSGDPAFFDANQGPAPGAQAAWIGHNIFNSLLTVTPPPALKVVPELAQSWDVLDEGRTYAFHLVEGVKFHDGTDFDAQAAKWNFERILDPEVHAWVRPYYMAVSNFANLNDINQRSVSFFHGAQSDYVGINERTLEAMVLQWRQTLAPEERKQISADI
jgi:ABC-type transport system substrate-binding protein